MFQTGKGITKFREYLWMCYALFADFVNNGIRLSFFKQMNVKYQ
ncbi:RAxF-45 family protein [Virgibacillus necropolis]|nr:RAxF-45 family protein [Virgibacillus necropolis]